MRRIHPLIFWPVAILLVVGLACVLAAPVHGALIDTGLMKKAELPQDHDRYFLKVLRRLLLVPLAAIFLWRVRPWRDGGWSRYGLDRPRRYLGRFLGAFAITVLVLMAVIVWQFWMGWLRFEDPLRWGELWRRLPKVLGTGLVVGFIEEWFFRGWVRDQFAKRHGARLAVLLSALAYALAHAFKPSRLNASVSHDAAGALEALRGWLAFMFDPTTFGASAVGLFLFALVLTAVYRRTGSLWPAIGVHAGAVWVLYCYGAVTERAPPHTWAGSKLLYDGPPAWGLFALALLLLWPRGGARTTAEDSPKTGGRPTGISGG